MKQDCQGRKGDSFECQQIRRGGRSHAWVPVEMPVDFQKPCYRLIIKDKNRSYSSDKIKRDRFFRLMNIDNSEKLIAFRYKLRNFSAVNLTNKKETIALGFDSSSSKRMLWLDYQNGKFTFEIFSKSIQMDCLRQFCCNYGYFRRPGLPPRPAPRIHGSRHSHF